MHLMNWLSGLRNSVRPNCVPRLGSRRKPLTPPQIAAIELMEAKQMMSATNVIANGSFEADPLPSGLNWDAFEFVTAWQVHATNGAKAEIQSISPRSGSNNGRQYLELDGDENGHPNRFNESPDDFRAPISGRAERGLYAVSQSFPTEADHTYDLYFDVKARDGRPAEDNRLKVIITDAHDDSVIFQEEIQAGAAWETLDYTFTAESENTRIRFEGLGPDNTFGAYLDDVRAYDQDETPDWTLVAPRVITADATSMRVAFSVKLPEEADLEEDIDNWDGEDVTFNLHDSGGVKASYTASITGGLAYATFALPSHVAGSTYWVKAEFDGEDKFSNSWSVIPGVASSLQASFQLNGATYASSPPISSNPNKTLLINGIVKDAYGNNVSDGTSVTWDDLGGADPGRLAWAGGYGLGGDLGQTIAGKFQLSINTNYIPGIYKLKLNADGVQKDVWVNGGDYNVTVVPTGRVLELDRIGVIPLTATVTLVSGGPVPNGTVVQFWDSRGWVQKKTATTTNGIATSWITIPTGTVIGTHLEGKVHYSASVLGKSADVPDYDFIDVTWGGAPPSVKLSEKMLNNDASGPQLVNVTTPDGSQILVSTTSTATVTAYRLIPGTTYRLRKNDPANVAMLRHEGALVSEIVFTADASTVFRADIVAQGSLSTAATAGVILEEQGTFGTWWSVGLSGSTEVAVAPAGMVGKFKQFADVLSDVYWGAMAGDANSWGGLAGDTALSLIPGIGVVTDIRDVGTNLVNMFAPSLFMSDPRYYDDPDKIELAIGVIGIITEFFPPVDYVSDGFRTVYKFIKAGLVASPFAIALTPLLGPAVKEFINYVMAGGGAAAAAATRSSASSLNVAAAVGAGSIDDIVQAMYNIGPNCRKIANATGLLKLAKNDPVLGNLLDELSKAGGDDLVNATLKNMEEAGYQAFADTLKAAYQAGNGPKSIKMAVEALAGNSNGLRALIKGSGYGEILTRIASIAGSAGDEVASELNYAVKKIADLSFTGSGTANGLSPEKWLNILSDIDDLAKNVNQGDLLTALRHLGGATSYPILRGRMFEVTAAAQLIKEAGHGVKVAFNHAVENVATKGRDTDIDTLLEIAGKTIAYEMKSSVGAFGNAQAVAGKIINYANFTPGQMIFVVPSAAVESGARKLLEDNLVKQAIEQIQKNLGDPSWMPTFKVIASHL